MSGEAPNGSGARVGSPSDGGEGPVRAVRLAPWSWRSPSRAGALVDFSEHL
jgi:hypothetical protein